MNLMAQYSGKVKVGLNFVLIGPYFIEDPYNFVIYNFIYYYCIIVHRNWRYKVKCSQQLDKNKNNVKIKFMEAILAF